MRVSFRVFERRLRALLRCWAVVFTVMAIVLAFFPERLVVTLNGVGAQWFHWDDPVLTPPTDRFFSILSASLLVLLALLAYGASQDLRHRLSAVRAILVSKLVSSALYALAFFTVTSAFAYGIGVVADGMIFAVTYYYYRRVRHLL